MSSCNAGTQARTGGRVALPRRADHQQGGGAGAAPVRFRIPPEQVGRCPNVGLDQSHIRQHSYTVEMGGSSCFAFARCFGGQPRPGWPWPRRTRRGAGVILSGAARGCNRRWFHISGLRAHYNGSSSPGVPIAPAVERLSGEFFYGRSASLSAATAVSMPLTSCLSCRAVRSAAAVRGVRGASL